MKRAVIEAGSKQYLVQKDDVIDIDYVGDNKKTLTFTPLLVFDDQDDKEIKIGTPFVKGAKVTAQILDTVRGTKTTAIRFKAKKRVHKTRGHRQTYSQIQITHISS